MGRIEQPIERGRVKRFARSEDHGHSGKAGGLHHFTGQEVGVAGSMKEQQVPHHAQHPSVHKCKEMINFYEKNRLPMIFSAPASFHAILVEMIFAFVKAKPGSE